MPFRHGSEAFKYYSSVELVPVSLDEIEAVLQAWRRPSTNGRVDADRLAEIPEDNQFRRLVLQNDSPLPVRTILGSVRNRWGAVALRESPYMDLEFWENHTDLYVRSLIPNHRSCERYHFFSGAEGRKDPRSYSLELAEELATLFQQGNSWPQICEKLADRELRYVGYCIVRPTQSFVISRTAIAFDSRSWVETNPLGIQLCEGEKNGGPAELTVGYECRAHLMNAELSITTPEFIQQDPNLGNCATASLWVASRRIGGPEAGTARFTMPTIGRQALGVSALSDSRKTIDPRTEAGLTSTEMCSAICQTGWRPYRVLARKGLSQDADVARQKNEARLRDAILAYTDSGYPALLCLCDERDSVGHVVATVGFRRTAALSLPDDLADIGAHPHLEQERAGGVRHILASAGVNVYFAHDDRYGPFNRVIFSSDAQSVNGSPHAPLLLVGRDPAVPMRLYEVAVPVPPNVRQSHEVGLKLALDIFSSDWEPSIDGVSAVWRSWLIKGSAYKQSLVSRDFPDQIRSWYSTMHLPQYVWVYEFGLVEAGSRVHLPLNRIAGEFVFDATAPFYEPGLLAIRSASVVWDHRMAHESREDICEPDEACALPSLATQRVLIGGLVRD